MNKKIVLIPFLLVIFLFLTACSENHGTLISSALTYDPEIYKYPTFIDDCDRFRIIFEQELEKYPLLENFDLPIIYALAYQESMCQTKDELHSIFVKNNDIRETWKGGIMQVDSCWRGNLDCSTIRNEIKSGMEQLNFSYSIIDSAVKKYDLELSDKDKIKLMLISYNRGFFVVDTALKLYRKKIDSGTFLLTQFTKEINGEIQVFVNCPEKDRCTNDGQFIKVNKLNLFDKNLDQALLIACRSKFGLMKDKQGDYCTGKDYGLNYPKKNFQIYDEIVNHNPITATKEKEFYIDEIKFSGFDWLIKKSVKKTGPGPNHFYYDNSSVFIDNQGYLHLKIINRDDKWYSSEVVLPEHLGFGEYTFKIKGNFTKMHENVVFGLFTYDLTMLPEFNHREIDFEISRWGKKNNLNAHFLIQGKSIFEPIKKFDLKSDEDLVVSFDWQPQEIIFELKKSNDNSVIKRWVYKGLQVPEPGEENLRMNLWIYDKPDEMEETEIIIKEFKYS